MLKINATNLINQKLHEKQKVEKDVFIEEDITYLDQSKKSQEDKK